jgi:3-mercaptopyruvate sulfurtransferase SseA
VAPIVDSRGAATFKEGAIETSINLPFADILNPDKTFISKDELKKKFKDLGIEDPSKSPVVLTC